jgi:hypothetical protein
MNEFLKADFGNGITVYALAIENVILTTNLQTTAFIMYRAFISWSLPKSRGEMIFEG